jgi:hypothetical protein
VRKADLSSRFGGPSAAGRHRSAGLVDRLAEDKL